MLILILEQLTAHSWTTMAVAIATCSKGLINVFQGGGMHSPLLPPIETVNAHKYII